MNRKTSNAEQNIAGEFEFESRARTTFAISFKGVREQKPSRRHHESSSDIQATMSKNLMYRNCSFNEIIRRRTDLQQNASKQMNLAWRIRCASKSGDDCDVQQKGHLIARACVMTCRYLHFMSQYHSVIPCCLVALKRKHLLQVID